MKVLRAAAAALTVASCGTAAPVFEGEPYGEPLTLERVTPVSEIIAKPAEYVGERVLIEGEVAAVCEDMGCWMDIVSGDELIQVKVDHGAIVFPISAKGRTALVEGVVEELKQSAEEARALAAHRAEEQGEPFDSTATYEARTVYRIKGRGALIR